MSLGPHASFIVASYIVTAIVVAGMIGWILRDYAAQRRILADLEQRGIRRRSQRDEIKPDEIRPDEIRP